LVKAGYVNERKKMEHNITGVLQGGIISPLFSNIYLHQLDLYMEELKISYEKKEKPRYTREYYDQINRLSKSRRDFDKKLISKCKVVKE